jgi:hypothetical protein
LGLTTEVAILNREAVALAADSAATVGPPGSQKIYTSANKIFGLSRRHPVAAMIYNSGAFMGVPWETIVKLYREELADTAYPTVEEYGDHFVGAVSANPQYCKPETQRVWMIGLMRGEVQGGFDALRKRLEQELAGRGNEGIGAAEISAIALDRFSRRLDQIRAEDLIDPDWTEAQLRALHQDDFKEVIAEVFGDLELSPEATDLLATVMAEKITRRHSSSAHSGVVVTGFGSDEIFPSLTERIVDGVIDGHLRAWTQVTHVVAEEGPAVVPFAQDDMARAFIEGVSPAYQRAIEAMVGRLVNGYPTSLLDAAEGLSARSRTAIEDAQKKIGKTRVGEALAELEEWRRKRFVDELIEIVTSLPKEELATLAEALVSLTSLRRRMSKAPETVGGPVDVAVISKGDGLIWIKRKHYFDPELNPQYLANRYGRP